MVVGVHVVMSMELPKKNILLFLMRIAKMVDWMEILGQMLFTGIICMNAQIVMKNPEDTFYDILNLSVFLNKNKKPKIVISFFLIKFGIY